MGRAQVATQKKSEAAEAVRWSWVPRFVSERETGRMAGLEHVTLALTDRLALMECGSPSLEGDKWVCPYLRTSHHLIIILIDPIGSIPHRSTFL